MLYIYVILIFFKVHRVIDIFCITLVNILVIKKIVFKTKKIMDFKKKLIFFTTKFIKINLNFLLMRQKLIFLMKS